LRKVEVCVEDLNDSMIEKRLGYILMIRVYEVLGRPYFETGSGGKALEFWILCTVSLWKNCRIFQTRNKTNL
jgi:hypothetical protein